MSMFLRIFLFFWLAAALIASSFFLLGRLSSSEEIEGRREFLQNQAITVSTLWNQGGQRLTRHWMMQLPRHERPRLVTREGSSPFPMHARRNQKLDPHLTVPIEEGVHHHRMGRVSLIVAVPDIEHALFLVASLEPSQLHGFPMWLRFLSAFIIISSISYLLALILSRRVRQLRTAVQGFSAGNLDRRVAITGNDEVSALAGDFNQMAERINAMLNSQRQLVSDVSHELRSPLARLRIALELAEKNKNSAKALPRIEKETEELENLVTELLSLARIESGQFKLEKQEIDLADLLQQIVYDANFEGQQKQCLVHLETADNLLAKVDPVLIRSAIENVIRNAIRHAPEQTTIDVRALREANRVQIIIEDSGPGVPESELDKLFEPFSRVAKARDRASGGFGLGLAITGRGMLAHNGQVHAENRPEGGLRIRLLLPTESTIPG
jgi:signal transduction histidine kinase